LSYVLDETQKGGIMTLEELKEVGSLKELYGLLEKRRGQKKRWFHRISSTSTFLANPLHYALSQGLGVNFGVNKKTIVGTAVHCAVDFAYRNRGARAGLCVKQIVESIRSQAKNLKPKDGEHISEKELIKDAIRLFMAYFKEVIPVNKVLESEEYLEVDIPVEMYKNPANFGLVTLTGHFDRIYEVDGTLVLSDLKTSAKTIGGSVEKPKELQDYEAEIGSLEKERKELHKIISKFQNASIKLQEIIENKDILARNIKDAKTNGRSTKSLENRVQKLEADEQKWSENLNKFLSASNRVSSIETRVELLENESSIYRDEYERKKAQADLEACKTQHGFQVSLYALMYMIQKGREIRKVRIENIVGTKSVQIQLFEWELDNKNLEKAEEAIQSVVSTIEAFYEGVDARVLFRPNPFTFYGSETNELVSGF